MRGQTNIDMQIAARALIDWWSLAGVDASIADEPRNWLRPRAPPPMAPAHNAVAASPFVPAPIDHVPMPAAPAAPPVPAMPDTLSAFEYWVAQDDHQPENAWSTARLAPVGNPGADLMIIADMPDSRDMLARAAFTDAPGRLLDAMLAAIGLTREKCYFASLSMARPPGGMASEAEWAQLAHRMRRHISLVGPRRVLLLGEKTSRALLAVDGGGLSETLRIVNHDGGTVSGIALYHPRFLLEHPAAKAMCWAGLRNLIEERSA